MRFGEFEGSAVELDRLVKFSSPGLCDGCSMNRGRGEDGPDRGFLWLNWDRREWGSITIFNLRYRAAFI